MSDSIGKPERATQDRVIALFRDTLGYRELGDWSGRAGNACVEEGLLSGWLKGRGEPPEHIAAALHALRRATGHTGRSLHEDNREVYGLLRYGVDVVVAPGKPTETVALIDWKNPDRNDFAIAEEVTLKGNRERRPDLVVYVNGLALGVIELKNSRTSLGDGIRQLISNQRPEFHADFFATVQLVVAGSDSEGLKYGTIGTEEKMFLRWKEDASDNFGYKLDKYLAKLFAKPRLLELVRDFTLFDGGAKKLPRAHQYFGIKAAQDHVRRRQGGILWHTQGSGKSIVMVLLAKWILENNPHARVAVITDRDELDKQIAGVFGAAKETIVRTTSGRDLMTQLARPAPRLLCSLVHKFGARGVDDFDKFIAELESSPSRATGEIFVFVDECHRTQSGKLHKVMKAMLPNAVFIGFTGTPLLKKDKETSLEVFGGYIHTYKFSEAVDDEVVLDLVYEARDIDQKLGSESRIDAWFDAKTRGLNDWQKAELKKEWVTKQRVLSSKSRMHRVVTDIDFDFATRPRLSDGRGNAILVASSIHEACKYFSLFQATAFKGRCAVVTSYNPQASDITKEDTGANTETDRQFIYRTYEDLLKEVAAEPGKSKTETYEDRAKKLFKEQPATMKLLVVVDKLLTGFDAPSCTYLYIDKSMQDHGLFQAICRTNRLDGDDKRFGHIVDYKDLFKKVENAIAVYTSELDHTAGGVAPEVLLKNRLQIGRERLDSALESLAMQCEPVSPPGSELDHIRYFCGNTEIPSDLEEREPLRVALYKSVVSLLRAYGAIAGDLAEAGYSTADITRIKGRLEYFVRLRDTIRNASGETLDLKPYEADMRHLIDTYIEASEPRKISPFDDLGLIELIVKTGLADTLATRLAGLSGNKDAVAEVIENNVRRKIIREHLNDPAFYERISAQLRELIEQRKADAIAYEDYLKRIHELVKHFADGRADGVAPELKANRSLRAVYNNLPLPASVEAGLADGVNDPATGGTDARLGLARRIDAAVRRVKPEGWRGVPARENTIKKALYEILGDVDEVERIFLIIKAQSDY